MKYDIDNAMQSTASQPWDLKLTIGGNEWPIRPLQVADLDRLGRLGDFTRDRQNEVVGDLFADPKPAVSAWAPQILSHIVAAVLGYQRGRVLKNCHAVASEVATATQRE
jgi:hypothetical protein